MGGKSRSPLASFIGIALLLVSSMMGSSCRTLPIASTKVTNKALFRRIRQPQIRFFLLSSFGGFYFFYSKNSREEAGCGIPRMAIVWNPPYGVVGGEGA